MIAGVALEKGDRVTVLDRLDEGMAYVRTASGVCGVVPLSILLEEERRYACNALCVLVLNICSAAASGRSSIVEIPSEVGNAQVLAMLCFFDLFFSGSASFGRSALGGGAFWI